MVVSAGDYRGIGGPHSVPLSAPGAAFVTPATEPHRRCLLDELFMAPSKNQLEAHQRIMHKRETWVDESAIGPLTLFAVAAC
jgi:hypothetical protein